MFTIFRSATLNEVSWSSKINSNFKHSYIAIYDFTAILNFGNYDTTTINRLFCFFQTNFISLHLCFISGWAKLLSTLTRSTYDRFRLFFIYMKILYVASENLSDLLVTYYNIYTYVLFIHTMFNYYFDYVFISFQ